MFSTSSDSFACASNCLLLDVISNSSLKLNSRAAFSLLASASRSAWLRVASEPGTGTVAYLPLIYPNSSFANAKVYWKIHCLPTLLVCLYCIFS